MDQLSLTFNEEISFQLKTTKWNFDSKPEPADKKTTTNMFVTLDRPAQENKKIIPPQEKLSKVEY